MLDAVLPEGDSAYVLGTSAGAIAALDLLARHPERLRHVVAHEPPCVGVLPDGARWQAKFQEVCDTYRTAGVQAAGARLGAVLAGDEPEESAPPGHALSREETPLEKRSREEKSREGKSREEASREEESTDPMALFLTRVLRQFTSYTPDLAALPARLTLAAGSDSRGQLPHRTARFIAERTQSPFAEFPGGHLGVMEHPAAFAERLTAALRAPVRPRTSGSRPPVADPHGSR